MWRQGQVDLLGPRVEPSAEAEHVSRPTPAVPPAGDPDLVLHSGRAGGHRLSPRASRVWGITACSIVAHAAGVAAVLVIPLLLSATVPEPADTVRAFFVEPMAVPPPPPPPPPPRAGARAAAARPSPRTEEPTDTFVAPVETPSELQPEEWIDLGIGGGVTGGVEGGVPGGEVGTLIPLPENPPSPPPPVELRAGVHVERPVKVRHVPPVYPEVAAQARVHGIVIIEARIDEQGRVSRTTLLRGMPLLSEAALDAVRQWEYRPTLLNGVPIAVTMTITVRFELIGASAD